MVSVWKEEEWGEFARETRECLEHACGGGTMLVARVESYNHYGPGAFATREVRTRLVFACGEGHELVEDA